VVRLIALYLKSMKNIGDSGKVFITGGTSGLGLELVKLFLSKGFIVVTTGRQSLNLPEYEDRFTFFKVNFDDLNQVAHTARKICETYDLNIVINNAGILSPPGFTSTINGFEYALQVNFLSHFLINEIILQKINIYKNIKIVTVTSPVYRLADTDLRLKSGTEHYSQVKTYSASKLYLTLMSEFLTAKYQEMNLHSFSYDPGTFSSVIYRSQKVWFRNLYHMASPFMRSPVKVARVLAELILEDETENGYIYDIRKRNRPIPKTECNLEELFFKECYDWIEPYLKKG
jgi:NAD(P)-dependent dehydrogenase (short-subunit alcohol dehydrogenase family)